MRTFRERAEQDFLLIAPPHPEVKVRLSDLILTRGDGSFQAYGAHILNKAALVPGINYSIKPINNRDTCDGYLWIVAPGVMLK